ncbi:hypothetical protein HUU05_17835 [candidate division KSB1 bacterium]|nr:hypothetical protein [candidate division KSB1 bacterium]
MEAIESLNSPDRLVADIDRLIDEMMKVRQRAAALAAAPPRDQVFESIRESEGFGIWADREDLQGLSSRDWLNQLRAQQWAR